MSTSAEGRTCKYQLAGYFEAASTGKLGPFPFPAPCGYCSKGTQGGRARRGAGRRGAQRSSHLAAGPSWPRAAACAAARPPACTRARTPTSHGLRRADDHLRLLCVSLSSCSINAVVMIQRHSCAAHIPLDFPECYQYIVPRYQSYSRSLQIWTSVGPCLTKVAQIGQGRAHSGRNSAELNRSTPNSGHFWPLASPTLAHQMARRSPVLPQLKKRTKLGQIRGNIGKAAERGVSSGNPTEKQLE